MGTFRQVHLRTLHFLSFLCVGVWVVQQLEMPSRDVWICVLGLQLPGVCLGSSWRSLGVAVQKHESAHAYLSLHLLLVLFQAKWPLKLLFHLRNYFTVISPWSDEGPWNTTVIKCGWHAYIFCAPKSSEAICLK